MCTTLTPAEMPETPYSRALSALEHLLRQIRGRRALDSDVWHAAVLLDTLPLAADEFGLARTRLINAQYYIGEDETGAAAWEVRFVVQQLRANATSKCPRQPRLRRRS